MELYLELTLKMLYSVKTHCQNDLFVCPLVCQSTTMIKV